MLKFKLNQIFISDTKQEIPGVINHLKRSELRRIDSDIILPVFVFYSFFFEKKFL